MMNRPTLILVSGPALAGKSTLIKRLQQHDARLEIVSSDDIRLELYGHYDYDPANEPLTWKTIDIRIRDALNRHHSVVLDSTLRTREKRDEQRLRYQHEALIHCIAFHDVSLDDLLLRNQNRSWKQFSPEVVTRLYHEYEPPTSSEIDLYDRFDWIPFAYSDDDIRRIIR